MAIYQGVNGVNREIKQIFQGVNGVNREVKDRWEGVGGVNRQVFANRPAGALYWYGDECLEKTGGWSHWQGSGSVIKYREYMDVTMIAHGKTNLTSLFGTTNLIDLAGYRKLCIKYKNTSFNGNTRTLSFSANSAKSYSSVVYGYDGPLDGIFEDTTVEINIGNQKLYIVDNIGTNDSAAGRVDRIYAIWLQ